MGDSNGVENQGMTFRWMEDQRQLQRVIKYGQVPGTMGNGKSKCTRLWS